MVVTPGRGLAHPGGDRCWGNFTLRCIP